MRWSRLVLILVLFFDVWYRGHTFGPTVRNVIGTDLWPTTASASEPLDCDEAAYAYIGYRIVKGDVMYRDLTENKPPLGYWLYALTVGLGGYQELAIRLMPIPFVLATIALVWRIALRLAEPGSACVAAAIFVFLSTDPYLFGNGANLEHFINCFAVASLALLLRGWDRASRWSFVGSGVCLGAATLVKQVAIAPVIIFVAALAWRAWTHEDRWQRKIRRCLFDVASFGIGLFLVLAAAATILIAQGAGRSAAVDIFQYGRALATDTLPEPNAPRAILRPITGNADPTGRLPWPFGTTDYLVWWGTGSWPLWLVSIPALAYLLLNARQTLERRLVAAWTLSAWAQVVLPGLYWPHYYLLPIAGTAIAVAVCLADGMVLLVHAIAPAQTDPCGGEHSRQPMFVRSRTRPWSLLGAGVSTLALALAIGATILLQIRDYLLVSPQELTIRYKGGRQWVVLRQMGREIGRRVAIWESPRIYVWGWQSPLHFYARLDSPTRHFFVDNLLRDQADRGHPLIAPRTDEIMAALRQNPPPLIFTGYAPFRALRAFLNEHYLPSRRMPGLWIKKDDFGRFETASMIEPRSSNADTARTRCAGMLVDHDFISTSKSGHDGVPALTQGIRPRRGRHCEPSLPIFDQFEECGGHAGWRILRFDENSRGSRSDGLADAAGTDGGDRKTRRHRLEHHVAECFRQARESEDVRRGVMVRQVLPLAISGEVSERTDSPFQCWSCRPVAYQQHTHFRAPGRDDRQSIREVVDVFLGRDPTHVGNNNVFGCPTQCPAYVDSSGPPRPKERAVDPALPQHQALKANSLELADRGLRRNIRLSSPVMKPSQVSPDHLLRPADMIMVAVLVKIGVET
jgi:4-amino-4-deoxy-L-arabinose transferase-like glycosyltransferase